jgi:ABC-type transport system involved in multi-copper enzyme maturation permease subunit
MTTNNRVGRLPDWLGRRVRVRLFGPVPFYDLIRGARNGNAFALRSLYPICLLLLFGFVGRAWLDRHLGQDNVRFSVAAATLPPDLMAKLAEGVFYILLGLQFGLAVLLTPGLVAPTVTAEKERKTLEFLFAADLGSAEIVLGKLLSRLGYLAYALLPALPVYGAVLVPGGIEPALVLAGFGVTALTAAGLAGVSILASVYSRRVRDAVLLSYLAVGLYLGLCLAGQNLVDGGHVTTAPLWPGGPSAVGCVRAFQTGNPGYGISRFFSAPATGIGEDAYRELQDYATFYALLTATTVSLAVWRLRPVALRELDGATRGKKQRRDLPPVGDRPMVWKEMYCGGARPGWWGKLLVFTLAAASFEPLLMIAYRYAGGASYPGRTLSSEVNWYVRAVGTAVALFIMLAAAVRAAVALQVEKDRDTLDGPLASPLSTREILFGKWVGCLWGLRWLTPWLGTIYLIGVATGGLSPLAVPLMAGLLLLYSGVTALMGLWSAASISSPRGSAMETVIVVLVALTGNCGLGSMCFSLFFMPFTAEEFADSPGKRVSELITVIPVGILYWTVLGGLSWFAAGRAFERAYNRQDLRSPEGQRQKGKRGPPAVPSVP